LFLIKKIDLVFFLFDLYKMPFVVSIEGNIGSGKSTIINALKSTNTIEGVPVVYVDEPVKQWEDIKNKDGKNMIELFYENPSRYSFAFQMMAYISRLTLLKDAIETHPNSIIITERCLQTDYNVFAKMLYEQGTLLEEEYAIYTKWFDAFAKDSAISAIVYVYCDPEVSFERCKKRNRTGESIPLEYLVRCHQKHEDWIQGQTDPIDTLIIDNNTTELPGALFSIHTFISNLVK